MLRTVEETETESLHLCALCGELGLTEEDVKRRNCFSDYINTLFSLEGIANFGSDIDFMFHAINIGSNAEGVGFERFASDYNIMMTISGTRITPQRQTEEELAQIDTHLFKVVKTYHPTYVRLQCVQVGAGVSNSVVSTPTCCIADEQGRMILAGKLLMESYSRDRKGLINAPAVSGVMQSSVKPILCIYSPVWPLSAREWAFRTRRYQWPNIEQIKYILQQGCHVVPIGNPLSPNKHIEWRWSFSLAEKSLVRTFNTTPLQCYFLLKLLVHYVINPAVVEGLSSYHVKTVMLHSVESTDPTEWMKERLAPCFLTCLQKLLQCLEDGSLTNYFISSHNLFYPRLQGDSRIRLVSKVTEQVEKGWHCILQCLPPNINTLKSRRHMPKILCGCYDLHWGRERCETNVSMVERVFTMFNVTVRVILKLTERSDLQATVDAMNMFLEYPTSRDTVHFPDTALTNIMKMVIQSHLGVCYMGLSSAPPYYRKSGPISLLPTAQKHLQEAYGADAAATKLKLATFYYMTENYDEAVKIAMQLLRQFNKYIVNTTGDKTRRHESCKRTVSLKKHRSVTSLIGNTPQLLQWATLELSFSPWEIPFVPEAIQNLKDKNALTDDDRDYNGFVFLDAIIYAYFVLAMSYNSIHRPVHRQQAMENLQLLINNGEESDLHYPEAAKFLLSYIKERKHRGCLLCHVRTR